MLFRSSGSQSWLQGETQDLSMTSQDLSLSASGHPHLISHHDVGPVSLFFHPFTGNYLELFKDLVISRLRDLILFATDLILFATSALLHLAISSSLIRLFYYYGSSINGGQAEPSAVQMGKLKQRLLQSLRAEGPASAMEVHS